MNEEVEKAALAAAVLAFGAALVYVAENEGTLESVNTITELLRKGDDQRAYDVADEAAKGLVDETRKAILARVEWELGR